MGFILEGILWLLGQLLWQLIAEFILESAFLFLDTVLVQRNALPERWSRIQLLATTILGPFAGLVSSLVVPHRAAQTVVARVAAWVVLPLLGGAALAMFNAYMADEDRQAARRLGWLSGILFGIGFLVGRRWGLHLIA